MVKSYQKHPFNVFQELRKYISVDIFGACGQKEKCPRDSEQCFRDIERSYKFYLSFENSFCKEYITEKFWKTLGQGTTHMQLLQRQKKIMTGRFPCLNQSIKNCHQLAIFAHYRYLFSLSAGSIVYQLPPPPRHASV